MKNASEQRLEFSRNNLKRAMEALQRSIELPINEPRDLSGIIKDFEIVYELAWKTLKIFLEVQGHSASSAREVFKTAFALGYLEEEGVWLEIIEDRNLTVHIYDQELAHKMVERIKKRYAAAFQRIMNSLFATTDE